MAKDDSLLSLEDAQAIGFKVVEMADRVRVVEKVQPGAQAKWGFDMDGIKYDVVITVRRDAR